MLLNIKIHFGTIEIPSKLQNKQRLLLPNLIQGTSTKEPRTKPSKDKNSKTRLQSVKTGHSAKLKFKGTSVAQIIKLQNNERLEKT